MSKDNNNRRNFLTKSAFGTAALATAPIVGSFTSKENSDKKKKK